MQISNGTIVTDRSNSGSTLSSVVAIGRSQNGAPAVKIFCTGVLVSSVHVLTAAHCVAEPDQMRVMFGVAQDGSEIYLRVARAGVHPLYDHKLPTRPELGLPPHDIALLTLASFAPVGWPPAPLADRDAVLPGSLSLAGFGVSETRNVADTGQLRVASVQLQAERSERQTLETSGGTFFRPIGGCAGDSGAPLSLPGGPVAGVLSTGGEVAGKCIGTNSFTDVRFYIPWIQGLLNADGQSLVADVQGGQKLVASLDTVLLKRSIVSGSRTGALRVYFSGAHFQGDQPFVSRDSSSSVTCKLSANYEMTLIGGVRRSRRWESGLFELPLGSLSGVQQEFPVARAGLNRVTIRWQLLCNNRLVALEPEFTDLSF
jgi:hypothetical protein